MSQSPERVAAPAPPVEEKPALNSPVQAKPASPCADDATIAVSPHQRRPLGGESQPAPQASQRTARALARERDLSVPAVALNHALEGLPAERTRYHICWGSWNGPHMFDVPLKDIVDLMPSCGTLHPGAVSYHGWM